MSSSTAPSIHSNHSGDHAPGSSSIRNAISKTRQKAKDTLTTLSPEKNSSSISLGSEGKSSTNLLGKLKQKRDERRDRKAREKDGYLDVDNRSAYDGSGDDGDSIRRPSAVPTMNSEASVETYEDSDGEDDDEPITNQGYLTLDEPSQISHHLTFPIVVSTSVEDPAHQPQTPNHLNPSEIIPTRRSTSPNPSASSRDASPTPSMISASPAASNILGGIFGIGNGKKRSGSTATRDTTMTDSSEKSAATANMSDLAEKQSIASTANSTPNLTPVKTVNSSPKPDITSTPPTPIEAYHKINAPPSQSTLSQRRGRNGSLGSMPSKLSQTQFAEDNKSKPLTPTIEVPTPGATPMVGSAAGGGFFGSMFAAAQNAASQLGSTINTTIVPGQAPSGKGKKLQPSPNMNSSAASDATEEAPHPTEAEKERKRLAVETLGKGELNLASLGITMDDTKELPRGRPGSRPSSAIYSDPDSVPATNVGLGLQAGDHHDDVFGATHPDDEARTSGYATPPLVVDENDNTLSGRRRSGSVRSAVGRASRRKRGSSVATNNIAMPEGGAAVKANGFAVATAKRNKDFHALFRSVPENDLLIEDYGCALQKEILLQGRIYVSEGHICFNSNIFGWVTTLVISFDEVVSIEKKMTAVVFPNAIAIQTLHARNVFASFISRDSSYDLLVGIWRMSHPGLRTSANEARLDDGSRERGSDSESEEDYADDDDLSGEVESTIGSTSDIHEVEKVESSNNNGNNVKVAPRKASSAQPVGGAIEEKPANGDAPPPAAGEGFPGPATHGPTTCGDEAQHFDKPLCDEIISAPLGKVFNIVFGDQSQAWMSKFLIDEEKILELSFDEGKFKENSEYGNKKTRGYTYIKPLTGSIGPKQTKCIITEIVEQEDLSKAVTVLMETRTPDVPNGGMFKVMTRYCLTWAENNQTRFVMNCAIEWSGKSWLKRPIEKGANDGQTGFCKDILIALRREFSGAKSASSKPSAGGKRSGKRKTTTGEKPTTISTSATASAKQPATSSNPLNSFLIEPLSNILGAPIAYAITAVIVTVVIYFLYKLGRKIRGIGSSKESDDNRGRGMTRHADVWNEMWMQEERGLWEWIEERAGGVAKSHDEYILNEDAKMGSKKKKQVDWNKRAKSRMMDEAEERLRLLKKAVDERLKKLEGAREKDGGAKSADRGKKVTKTTVETESRKPTASGKGKGKV